MTLLQTSDFTPVAFNKIAFSLFGATAVTFALFAFMQYLTSQDLAQPTIDKPVVDILILQDREDSKVIERTRVLTPPPMPMERPTRPIESESTIDNVGSEITTVGPSFDSVDIDTVIDFNTDRQATPMFRTTPNYPPTAARDGIEGWVEMQFAISPTGEVIDVRVTNSEPKRVFDKAAIRALKKWKYRPLVVDGKPQVQQNQKIVLEFNLQQE
ncbi:energy transducer TonB [Pseudoalteromonas sp. T1lg65]|uniref:energy transducer TonB n=1 Tax=Pseudoalteromonas sp. T1lg65 TaxID=2077101 RepID=UPI003F794A5D